MAVSSLKPTSGVNDFNLSLSGPATSILLDKEYAPGAYSIVSSSNDTTLDVYAYNADGSLAAYSPTKSINATKGFNKIVVIGGTNGDILSFAFKKTYVTSSETTQVTAGPYILNISPSALPNVNDVTTITGGNFAIDVEVHFIGQNNVVYDAKSITRISATEIQVMRPDTFSIAQSPYSIRVMNPGVPNPSGSSLNIASNSVSAGSTTSWVTNSPLPAFSVNFPYSTNAVATDPDGSTITYSLVSGAFPTGISLASNGTISGTNTDVTTEGQAFTVVIRATDQGGNFTDRSFTLNSNLRPVWVTNAGDLPAFSQNVANSTQLEATSGSFGGAITYAIQSGSLPIGVSLSSSGLISGTSTASINSVATFTVRATDSLGASTDRQFNILTDAAGQQVFTSSTTWTVPANVTSVSVVAVGGGGGGSASTTAQGGFSGGGGAGGALHWRNAISVTPGETLNIGVGAAGAGGAAAGQNNATAGGESFVKRGTTYLVQAPGGEAGKYNLNNTSLGGVPTTALGGGGGTGGRGGFGVNGLGQAPAFTWNGTTATATLSSTGGAQTLTFPTNAVVTFDIAGGKGGGGSGGGANGGRLQGTFTATAGTYQINVGGAGNTGSGAGGGWNGGGNAGGSRGDEGSGGGATDIRPSSDTSLNGRIAVAAGGGGQGGFYGGAGGAGGGTQGSNGTSGQGQGGSGASQSAGGNGGSPNGGTWGTAGGFGIGGTGGTSSTSGGGGGGGGYYGGGGGGADIDGCCTNGGGGGGGSSWASGAVSNVTNTANYNNGAGYAILTFATATNPNVVDSHPSGGGGGAAGYSGNGGDGASNATFVATAGTGGGGSGSTGHNAGSETGLVGGGGVGLLGEGASGTAPAANAAQAGNPGSGGVGRNYGAGGAGADDDSSVGAGVGGSGAVRIIWGSGRQFPATQTGDK